MGGQEPQSERTFQRQGETKDPCGLVSGLECRSSEGMIRSSSSSIRRRHPDSATKQPVLAQQRGFDCTSEPAHFSRARSSLHSACVEPMGEIQHSAHRETNSSSPSPESEGSRADQVHIEAGPRSLTGKFFVDATKNPVEMDIPVRLPQLG